MLCYAMLCQVEAVFVMFDVDSAGALPKGEFRALIKATVSLNLSSLLGTGEGQHVFEETLEKEYSEENLAFWKEAVEYAELADGAARAAKAKELLETFVKDGAERCNARSRPCQHCVRNGGGGRRGQPPRSERCGQAPV